jgi:hypothetical protein
MVNKVKVAFVTVALISAFSSSAFADLTGKWNGNDGGKYYVRQIGSEVFWYGEKAATSPQWSNVAYGRYAGNKLTLRWADVPKGTIMQHGQLVINVARGEQSMTVLTKTGGFGGSSWTKQP